MRRNWQSNRVFLLSATLLLSVTLIVLSSVGILAPIENIIAAPLNLASRLMTQVALSLSDTDLTVDEVEELRRRNAELEESFALLQGELIELREISSDYERLADLLDYTRSTDDREYLTADVIGIGQYGLVRSIIINKGTRDGLAVGMPVVTELGLVGRIYSVNANFSQVQLITDTNSYVSGRLLSSRAEGTVRGRGLETSSLEMIYIPSEVEIAADDLVVTSGLGGNFPPDIVIGQISSIQSLESELTQSAQINSLIDFRTLEFVLVVINFEPADLSVFDEDEDDS